MKQGKFLTDERGNEVPISLISSLQLKRHETVVKAVNQAIALQEHIQKQKKSLLSLIERFLTVAYEDNGLKYEGKKGNFTLFAFNQQLKVVFTVPEDIIFTEELQVALKAMRECMRGWIADGQDELQFLLQDLMNVDRQGRINRYLVIRLLKIKSKDVRWQKAQKVMQNSMQVVKKRSYLRFYQKDERGNWNHVNLNFSDL